MQQTNAMKWVTMTGLMIVSILLTIYCHGYLGTAAVFTHLFYIPIILGALWWGAPGVGVAVILALFLAISHRIFSIDVVGLNDYFRGVIFIVVSVIVVALRSRIKTAEAALHRQTHELENRVKALSCLYGINSLREDEKLTVDDLFRETVNLLEQALRNGSRVSVRVGHQGRWFDSADAVQGGDGLAATIVVQGQPEGEIRVCWPDHHTRENAGQLIESVAKRIGKVVEHEKARQELNRYRAHLEDLVRERTQDLIEANRRMQMEAVEREKAQAALGESEKRYRILFENAGEGVFIAQDGHVRFANPALTRLTGFDRDELDRRAFWDWIHEDDRAMVSERYTSRMAGETVPSLYAFRITRRDGTMRWVELDTVVIQWQERPATLNFLRDITARKKMEAAVGQMQKMETVGVLAGGVAHQFNNALAVITGNMDLLKLALPNQANPDQANIDRYAGTIMQSVRTMTGLTQQLLAYARGGKYQSRHYSMPVLVKDVLCQVTSVGDKTIDFVTSFSSRTPMVEADPVQMRMVMLAIINNAVEAIADRGRIRIDTHRVCIDEMAAGAFEGLPLGEYAGLSIRDDGSGMSERVREKIFEPFFSTKFLGRGLGMASAYGIIKNHGGYIYVDSEPGRGTTVHILLPPGAKEKDDARQEQIAPARAAQV